MKELLQAYTLDQIAIFIVLLALAVKGFVDFYDWAKARFRKPVDKEYIEKEKDEKIKSDLQLHTEKINELVNNQLQMQEHIKENNRMISLLIESDKDDIKA